MVWLSSFSNVSLWSTLQPETTNNESAQISMWPSSTCRRHCLIFTHHLNVWAYHSFQSASISHFIYTEHLSEDRNDHTQVSPNLIYLLKEREGWNGGNTPEHQVRYSDWIIIHYFTNSAKKNSTGSVRFCLILYGIISISTVKSWNATKLTIITLFGTFLYYCDSDG